MKKIALLPIALLTVAVTAFASNAIEQLNQEIVNLLAPFQNEKTQARLVFNKIETSDKHALNLDLNAYYQKVGSLTSLLVNLDKISYSYNDGVNPTTHVRGNLGIELNKLVPQEDLNELIPGVEDLLQSLAKEYLEVYGDAVDLSFVNINKIQDENGNYVSISGDIVFSIDFTKLPEEIDASEIPVKAGNISVGLDVRQGLNFDVLVESNPSYKGYEEDNLGLKEILDLLLNKDEAILEQIQSLFSEIDHFAGNLVEGQL
ncbi:MAG: hypothetical protein M9962_02785 [Oligoflexia bacterium]|nr:hypothetical protein [Oligoflexia bacterium]